MTKSDDRGEDLSNLALYRSKVPVRECFLYLVQLACVECSADNSVKANSWVVAQDFKFDEEATSSDGSPVAHLKMMILIAKCHTGAGERAHIPVKLYHINNLK